MKAAVLCAAMVSAVALALAGLSPALAQMNGDQLSVGSQPTGASASDFDLTSMRTMPGFGTIPDPHMSVAEVDGACVKYFENTTYTAPVSVEGRQNRERVEAYFITGKFRIDRRTEFNERLQRPICVVSYLANNRYYSSNYAGAYFDGKTLWYYTNLKDPAAGGFVIRVNLDDTLAYRFFWRNDQKEPRITTGTFRWD